MTPAAMAVPAQLQNGSNMSHCMADTMIRLEAPYSFWGTIDLRTGTTNILSETLFGQTRGAVLSVLYGHVGKAFYLRQLARLTDISLGPVQREIRQLVAAGLVTRKTVGPQTLYTANQKSPVFREIKNLVNKTVGMHDVLASDDAARHTTHSTCLKDLDSLT